MQVLNAIYDMADASGGEQNKNMARIAHALAMLFYILHNIDKVRLYFTHTVKNQRLYIEMIAHNINKVNLYFVCIVKNQRLIV